MRFISCLFFLFVFVGCTLIPPPYDEIIPLTPDLGEEGNALLRTQTLWTNNFDTIIIQVIQIDTQLVGVKYMHKNDFRKLPKFSNDYSFGNRLFIIPPGKHNIVLSYKGKTSHLLGPDEQEHSGVILYEATIPADETCAFMPKTESAPVDIYNLEIRLTCRK